MLLCPSVSSSVQRDRCVLCKCMCVRFNYVGLALLCSAQWQDLPFLVPLGVPSFFFICPIPALALLLPPLPVPQPFSFPQLHPAGRPRSVSHTLSLENVPIYLCFPPAQGDPTNLWKLYEVICLSKLTAASGLNFWSVSFLPPSKSTTGCRQQPPCAGWGQHDLPRARGASRGGSGSPSFTWHLAPSVQVWVCP